MIMYFTNDNNLPSDFQLESNGFYIDNIIINILTISR